MRLEEVRLAFLSAARLELKLRNRPEQLLVGRHGLKAGDQLLEGLLLFSLLGIHPGQEDSRVRNIGVCLHALLAHHHRFHETPHCEVRLGHRLVGLGAGVGRECMLQLCEVGRGQRFDGVRHHRGESLSIFRSLSHSYRPKWACHPRACLDTPGGVRYPKLTGARGCSSVGRASRSQCEGRRFDPVHLQDQESKGPVSSSTGPFILPRSKGRCPRESPPGKPLAKRRARGPPPVPRPEWASSARGGANP